MVEYDLFCFSVFFERPEKLLHNISDFFFDKNIILDRTLQYSTESLNSKWLNPKSGSLPKFFLGSCKEENFSVFFSNLPDGWTTAARKLSRDSKSRLIQVRVSNPKSQYPVYTYEVIENGITTRIVQLLKEVRWNFFEKGIPLPYENTLLYQLAKTKNKLSTTIILNYLEQEKIDYSSICNREWSGVVFHTNSY